MRDRQRGASLVRAAPRAQRFCITERTLEPIPIGLAIYLQLSDGWLDGATASAGLA